MRNEFCGTKMTIYRYVVSKDIEMLAPEWLASRIDHKTVKILFRDVYGHFEVKGVRIGDEFARIGDTIVYDGKRISIERRQSTCLGAVRKTAGKHAAVRWVLFLCRKTGQMIRPKTVSCLVDGYTPINNLVAAGKGETMKTEFLKELGLDQETINKIMEENGKDIAAEQAKTTKAAGERDNYKDQLATAQASLEKFKDVDPAAMQSEIDKLNQQLKDKDSEYAAKEADRVFSETLKEAIKSAGGRNEKSVMALLDIDTLKASKDQSTDIKKALDAVKESDAYLFGADEPFLNPVGPTGGTEGAGGDAMASIRAAMGLPEKK